MKRASAAELRIPKIARDALAQHEEVVVLYRGRPAYVIRNADDQAMASASVRRGRPLKEALAMLSRAPLPDPSFADDLEALRESDGQGPVVPLTRT
jgi:hypothetical protein